MTNLATRKTKLVIESESTVHDGGRYRNVILEAHPTTFTVRLKGLKTSYEISAASIYHLAVKQSVEAARRSKR